MFWKKAEQIPLITPDELARLLAGGRAPVLVDVRSQQGYGAGHLPGAINIPLDELEQRANELDPTAPTVFY